MPCFGHIAVVLQSLLDICPQISQRRDLADEEFSLVFSERWSFVCVGDADFVYPPLRRGSCRVSYSNPEWAEIGQVSEGEDGRKTSDVGERDRVEVFCGKCGNM